MIHKVGNGPWMITVQAPTYTHDVTISDDMANTITAMIAEAVQAALKAKEVNDDDQT